MYSRFKDHGKGLIVGVVVLAVATYVLSDMKNKSDQQHVQAGKQLAARYCASCHQLPDPLLLPKNMWHEGVLPRMGPFLGITEHKGKTYYRANDVDKAFFPVKPVLNTEQWDDIVNYYLAMAPDVLPEQHKPIAIKKGSPFFAVELPRSKFFYGTTSMTSYIKIDMTVMPHRVMVNDGINNRFFLLDDKLNFLNGFTTHGTIVDVSFKKEVMLATSIGKTPEANNRTDGEVIPISINSKSEVIPSKALFSKLARPVKVVQADLNADGKTDHVIAEFGNLIGDLAWMENKGGGKFIKRILKKAPGALGAVVYDHNHDGLPDVYALFAQGDEGIFLFINKGKGEFEEHRLLSFPPTFGSTGFELVDMNNDGYPDIVYTCGDNGDETPVLKPYHGVYIYMNDGNGHFSQKYFYAINGCNKAITRDFDGDGLPDIAAVSFYPSSARPEEAFVFLHNKSGSRFEPYGLPAGTPFQKGVTIDAGDLDGDGRLDLVLGNGYYTSNTTSTHKEPLFLFLRNITTN